MITSLSPVDPPFHGNFRDITGVVSGRLTALHLEGKKDGAYYWRCKCECGNETVVIRSHISKGVTKSCGCLTKEVNASMRLKHGRTDTKTYGSWLNMRRRCNDPKSNRYESYGGRGIKVCDRWNASFQNFLDDMGERPDGCSIERENNDGNYEPGNCVWLSNVMQCNNRRNNVRWRHNGKSLTIAQWSRKTGIAWDTLKNRVSIHGWSIQKALDTPINRKSASGSR